MSAPSWTPRDIQSVVRTFTTSTRPAYVTTDAGEAYAKALGNPEGPIVLASEWIGRRAAEFIGLPTLDAAIVRLDESCCWPVDESDASKGRMEPGPAFATRAVLDATTWSRDDDETLGLVTNPECLAGLIVVDTWLRNRDRCSPDGRERNERNVLLVPDSAARGKYRIVAMDFSHAVSHGRPYRSSDLGLDARRDERIYGCFPEFRPFLTREHAQRFVAPMASLTREDVQQWVHEIPQPWYSGDRNLLISFIVERASFLHRSDLAQRIADLWSLSGARDE